MIHLKPSKISSQNAFLTGLWRVSLALLVGHRLLGNTELVWMSENPALWPHGCRLLCSYEFPKLGLEPRAVVSVVTLCDHSASPGTRPRMDYTRAEQVSNATYSGLKWGLKSVADPHHQKWSHHQKQSHITESETKSDQEPGCHSGGSQDPALQSPSCLSFRGTNPHSPPGCTGTRAPRPPGLGPGPPLQNVGVELHNLNKSLSLGLGFWSTGRPLLSHTDL